MTNLKKEKVIGRTRFLFYDLLGRYDFSDDDENRIIRCAADLSECIKEIEEDDTQTDLRNIEDMQAEINRLRETLIRINTLLSENIRPCIFKNATTVSVPIVTLERLTAIIRHSLNREREGKND